MSDYRTLPATPPEPAGLQEVVWLIERGQPERQVPTVWWTGHDWTEDPNKATRYASREDAEDRIARTFTPPPSRGGPSARAIEHIWLDTSYHRRRVARRNEALQELEDRATICSTTPRQETHEHPLEGTRPD